jgi:hypothetical protein
MRCAVSIGCRVANWSPSIITDFACRLGSRETANDAERVIWESVAGMDGHAARRNGCTTRIIASRFDLPQVSAAPVQRIVLKI